MKKESSFYEKSTDPVWIFISLLACQIVLVLGAKLLGIMNVFQASERFPWMAGAAMLFVFSMFSCLLLIPAKDVSIYIKRAMYSFMGLIFFTYVVAWLFTGKMIDEVGSFKWIYLVLTVGFLLFIGITVFVRQLITFAEEEDWQGPRRGR